MKTTRFHSFILFSLLLFLILMGSGVAFAEEPEASPSALPEVSVEPGATPEAASSPEASEEPEASPEMEDVMMIECTDCAAQQAAARNKADDISAAQNNIQAIKDQIESDLSDISITTEEEIDAEFASAIDALIVDSGCSTEAEYGDILPEIDGIKGYLYNQIFYCPDAASLETFIAAGFNGTFLEWSTTFNPDNTTAWEAVSESYLQFESDLDDYFAMLLEYGQLLSDAQDCVEMMLGYQMEGQCTDTVIDHGDSDIPEDFEDVVDCPDCSANATAVDDIEAELAEIEDEVAAKNQEIADLNDQLQQDQAFESDIEAAIASANCETEEAFEDITIKSGQAAGVIYGVIYHCKNEADVEALIAALDAFWETNTAPSGDETFVEQINDLLSEIETLLDEYNDVLADLVMAQEDYQDCLDYHLSLQAEGYCLDEEEVEDNETGGGDNGEEREDNEIGGITPPSVGGSVTISATKRRSGSGGSSASLNYCDYTIFSDITPVPNTMTKQLSQITFTAKSTIKLDSMQLTVAGEAVELKATKNTNGSYAVVGMPPTAISTNGKYRIELFGKDGTTPSCSRQRLHTIQVDSRIGTVDDPDTPEDESAGIPKEGDLFSDAIDFSDIGGHWAAEYIRKLANRGIVSGYGDGRFGPDNNITRAELTKIALEAFAIGKMDVQENPFLDVDAAQWYAPYVAQAKTLAIIAGYDDGTFQPNNSITRAEGLKILLGAANIDVSAHAAFASNFADVEVGVFYTGHVNWAVEKGIINGYGNGIFGPNDTLTRGQLAKIAINLLEYLNR